MVLRPFLPYLHVILRAPHPPFHLDSLFGKCCFTNLEWSNTTRSWTGKCSYFCIVSLRDDPKLVALGALVSDSHCCWHCPSKLPVSSWVKENVKHSSVSLRTGCSEKRDVIPPTGRWRWLELQLVLFSWHCGFCQKNFFVSNIDVWKWRNWWWARSV